jgi:hypothetical protein
MLFPPYSRPMLFPPYSRVCWTAFEECYGDLSQLGQFFFYVEIKMQTPLKRKWPHQVDRILKIRNSIWWETRWVWLSDTSSELVFTLISKLSYGNLDILTFLSNPVEFYVVQSFERSYKIWVIWVGDFKGIIHLSRWFSKDHSWDMFMNFHMNATKGLFTSRDKGRSPKKCRDVIGGNKWYPAFGYTLGLGPLFFFCGWNVYVES